MTGTATIAESLLPWHTAIWQQLALAIRQDRVPHALLLTGLPGVGKARVAHAFARALLCEQRNDDMQACGHCQPCHLAATDCAPDLHVLEPEEPGKAIRIDAVRQLGTVLQLTAHAGDYRVGIINPADAMNRNAANSLLKTLEEPAPGTVLILLTSHPHRLPATVRSRCQQLLVAPPDTVVASEWLQQASGRQDAALLLSLAGGAPLRALALAEAEIEGVREQMLADLLGIVKGQTDPLSTAKQWLERTPGQYLHWLSALLIDTLRLKCAANPPTLINKDLRKPLQALASRLDLLHINRRLDAVLRAIREAASPLNALLQLQALLIEFSPEHRT